MIQWLFDAIFGRLPLFFQLLYLRIFEPEAFAELEKLHELGYLDGNRTFWLNDHTQIVVTTETVLVPVEEER